MRLLIKLPSRSRPAKLLAIASKYVEYAEDMRNVLFLISLDSDDPTVTDELKSSLLALHPNIHIAVGLSTGKIGAINRDMPHPSLFDIVLLASDDMIPLVKGFDNIIRNKMKKHYPDTDGVLFFNDGYNLSHLNTLLICGSKYYSRFGYLYYPEYKSFFCDNEFMDVAARLRRQTYFSQVIIKHDNFNTNPAVVYDELYQRNQKFLLVDKELYLKRLHRLPKMKVWSPPKISIKLKP
jgi:hypothetical protein